MSAAEAASGGNSGSAAADLLAAAATFILRQHLAMFVLHWYRLAWKQRRGRLAYHAIIMVSVITRIWHINEPVQLSSSIFCSFSPGLT